MKLFDSLQEIQLYGVVDDWRTDENYSNEENNPQLKVYKDTKNKLSEIIAKAQEINSQEELSLLKQEFLQSMGVNGIDTEEV